MAEKPEPKKIEIVVGSKDLTLISDGEIEITLTKAQAQTVAKSIIVKWGLEYGK